jgi:parvulin-like peptidyl-prolyl isomerase
MKKILKEPLLHFLLIGALLFLVYNVVNTEQNEDEIIIDDNLINELGAKWEMKWNRQPNLQELHSLVSSFIEQEILYREALAMNLDHNDEIVKRRLAQKMEFISDELAEVLQPTEEMLKEYFEKNKENYTKPSVFSFKQVYFSKDKRTSAVEDAKRILEVENPEDRGDHLSLPSLYTNTDALKIARDFGSTFAAALDTLPVGEWTGPIYSGLGVHIVYISARKPAGFYAYEEVANKVNVDYNFHASNEFKKELIASLLNNYTINFQLNDSKLKEVLSESF